MEVVVAVGHGGLAVEGDHNGLVGIVGQRDGDLLPRVGYLVIDIIAVAVVAPNGGIGRAPSGTQVRGNEHHELVVRLTRGVRDGGGAVPGRERKVEHQHRAGHTAEVDGGRHQPLAHGSTVNVHFRMVGPEHIGVVEHPSGGGGAQGCARKNVAGQSIIASPALREVGGAVERLGEGGRENGTLRSERGVAQAAHNRTVGTNVRHIPGVSGGRKQVVEQITRGVVRDIQNLRPAGVVGSLIINIVVAVSTVPGKYCARARHLVGLQTAGSTAGRELFHGDVIDEPVPVGTGLVFEGDVIVGTRVKGHIVESDDVRMGVVVANLRGVNRPNRHESAAIGRIGHITHTERARPGSLAEGVEGNLQGVEIRRHHRKDGVDGFVGAIIAFEHQHVISLRSIVVGGFGVTVKRVYPLPALRNVVFGCAVEILHIRQTYIAAFDTGTIEGNLRVGRAVGEGQRRGIRSAIGWEISDIQRIARIRYRNEIAEVVVVEGDFEGGVHRDINAARDIVALHRQRLRGGRGTRRHVQKLKRSGQRGDEWRSRKSRHRDVIQTKQHLVGTVEVSESDIDRLTGVSAQINRPHRPYVSCLRRGLLKQQCKRRGIGRRCGRNVHSVMLGIERVANHTVKC